MGRCYNSVMVKASSEQVWKTIKDFHDMSWAPGVVEKLEKVGEEDGLTPGAKRVLNDAFHETLLSVDDEHMVFIYSIEDGPAPVSKKTVKNYIGKVKLHPVTLDGTTFMEWESVYESPDDNAVRDFCNPIYEDLLGALKDHFE